MQQWGMLSIMFGQGDLSLIILSFFFLKDYKDNLPLAIDFLNFDCFGN